MDTNTMLGKFIYFINEGSIIDCFSIKLTSKKWSTYIVIVGHFGIETSF